MGQVALIYGSVFVYWQSIFLVMAAGAAICLYLSLCLTDRKNTAAAMLSVPLAMVLSLVLARLVHWYCRADQYESLAAALTNYRSGGYALVGVFGGCILAAALLRLVRISRNLPRMLDCMAIAGCAGIAVGRLACFFASENRGMVVTSWTKLPWAWVVTNPVSGVEEMRLATFFLQTMVAGVLFAGLLVFWLVSQKQGRTSDGDVCLIFLLCYGASQVLLDSTRYDSLYFRSNGFVSVVQVLGACAIGLAAVLFSVRLVRQRGWKRWYLALWILLAGLIGAAGFMEYFVQRWSKKIVIGYNIMAILLLLVIAVIFVIRCLAQKQRSNDYDS